MVKVALDKQASSAEGAGPQKNRAGASAPKSRWLFKILLLAALVLAVAPSLISLSGQTSAVLRKVHPALAAAVSFQSVKMHWWSPVEISGLKIRDLSEFRVQDPTDDNSWLCSAKSVVTTEPLWRIVLNAGRGTGVVVQSPALMLITDERGTNLEQTVRAVFGSADDSSSSVRFPFRINVIDGTVDLLTAAAPVASDVTLTTAETIKDSESSIPRVDPSRLTLAARASEINGAFSTMDTERWLPEMRLTAAIRAGQADPLASTSGRAKAVPRPTRLAAGLDEIVKDFPTVPLEDLAGPDDSGDGTGARIQIHLKPRADEKGRQTIQIGARDVDLRLLQPVLSLTGLDLACDGVVTGGIDARLAGADLKEGLVGRLMLQGDNVRVRQLTWAQEEWLNLGKMDASGAVAVAEDGILIQDLLLNSDLIQLKGSGELRHRLSAAGLQPENGTSQQIEIKGVVNLAQLGTSLRKTLVIHEDVLIKSGRLTFGVRASAGAASDVAEWSSPAGPGNEESPRTASTDSGVSSGRIPVATVGMTSREETSGKWQIVVKTEGLQAVRGDMPIKVDPTLRLDGMGTFAGAVPELVKARLTADFGTIDCVPDKSAWKISGLVQPTALWQQLQQFADVPQPGLQSDISFQMRVAMQGEAIQLTDLQVRSSDVNASSVALEIMPSNPLPSMLDGTIHVEGTGAALRTLLAPWYNASWLSERSSVVSDLTASPTREMQLIVHVTPAHIASVQGANVLSVSRTSRRTVGAGSGSPESAFVIDEADLNLSLVARSSGKDFDVQKSTIKLPGLVALVTGSISVPESDLLLDLTADTSYDLDILSRRLFLPESGLSFSGQGRDTFRLTGSPSALSGVIQRPNNGSGAAVSTIKGAGTVKWTAADVWGLQLGPATVQGTLENSLVRSSPIQCSLNGGELNTMPQYDLANSRLQLGTGSRVQNLHLTPALCRTWLGYVAPMLADTAEVTGEVSARVERFLWDFNVPENSDVAAQLTIHKATASPGSSLSSLLQVVELLRKSGDSSQNLAERSLILPEQTVPVTIRQGYVTHEGLTMELSGYRMKTGGTVGLNKQLQMTVDVPLEKSTATSSGRSVKIPLRGTISQPQPDTSALLQSLGSQKIQEQIGSQVDKVDKTLNKQLNKLFDKF